MSDNDIKQMQEKIDEAIRKTQEKLVEKTKQQDGTLIVTRDGKLMAIGADDI
jgi:low affinity Fe/Cu permease